MLYVFHVDTGTTFSFEIKLALASVSELKEAIERECNVAVAHQVLLMSGGDSLESNARVCSYSAGTDTNPIYLFNKAAIESQLPPQPSLDYGSDVDLQSQMESSLAMPATYQTLVARAQLAKHCCGLARDQMRICERLVHEQHLQQQGWSAVVANLEDIIQTFGTRSEMFQNCFVEYLSERQEHMELLENFCVDLETLEKIPILPALKIYAEGFVDSQEQQEQQAITENDNNAIVVDNPSIKEAQWGNSVSKGLTLLKWISAKDNQSSLELVAEQCSRGIEQFDQRVMETLKTEINIAFEGANKQDMKEIKGLGDRLFALEQLMAQTKKLLQEQLELSHGFNQNRDRVSKLNDESVLPDLCMSHRKQLEVMLKNHNQLRDIRRRCTKAKEELSVNIHRRLKWIMYVESKIMEVDNKIVMYHESLRRLRRQLLILRQIHLAPEMYVRGIVEVVRRRTYSQAYLAWATNVARKLASAHSEETERRREFQNIVEGHFMKTLFPGLGDVPPPFATQLAVVFDNDLPELNLEDMEWLQQQLPDLANRVPIPNLSSIKQFFFSISIPGSNSDGNKEKESSSMRVDEVPKGLETIRAPFISDRGGFESETDTEEFEKIGQLATDSKLTSYESTKQQTPIRQKQMEVGVASISTSSASTNASPLNRSTSSSSELLQFPSLSISEKKDQQPLSPLTECVEHTPPSPKSALNFLTNTATSSCDGQQKKLRRQSGSDGSSPSVGNGIGPNDFFGTEFYMDESLPSSLSEHPTDSQHQAILSLLQEDLGNTREEVVRLRATIRNLKSVAMGSLLVLRRELGVLKEQALEDRESVGKLIEDIGAAVTLHTCALREREQENTVDHEIELSDLKKMLQDRDDEVRILQRTLMEEESQRLEQERLIRTMRQKFEGEQQEMKKLQTAYRQIEERLEQSHADKETAIKQCEDARVVETNTLKGSLEQCQERIRELEEKLASAKVEYQKAIKEESDKLQLEYKAQYETMRSRFKLMHASTMERSPSDLSLEKIERVDLLELANQETMISQAVEAKRDECKRAIQDDRLKISQTNSELGESMKSEKSDDVKVSESKKVRLETDSDSLSLPMKLELLEADNKRLNSELRASRESKEEMEAKLEALANEKSRLEVELLKERVSKRTHSSNSMSTCSIASSPDANHDKDMNLSVAAIGSASPSRVDAATSTERSRRETLSSHSVRDKLTKSTTTLVQPGKIVYTSCNAGDIVLVTWDQAHRNYTLLQDSPTFYFLNSDCIADLDLKLGPDGQPLKWHVVAEVVEKEYCSARKPENRYRVPQGTKFFRVRVKPLQRPITTGKH